MIVLDDDDDDDDDDEQEEEEEEEDEDEDDQEAEEEGDEVCGVLLRTCEYRVMSTGGTAIEPHVESEWHACCLCGPRRTASAGGR